MSQEKTILTISDGRLYFMIFLFFHKSDHTLPKTNGVCSSLFSNDGFGNKFVSKSCKVCYFVILGAAFLKRFTHLFQEANKLQTESLKHN